MKKYVVTSLVALSVASITGLTIGLAINRPVQLNTKNAATAQNAPSLTTNTSTTTAASAPQPVAQPAPSTNTAPTTTSTSATTNTATMPAPVTVVSFKQVPLDNSGNIDCEYTYSDNTTYQWHWTVVNPQGSWVTDGTGNNGHWEPSTQATGTCDASVVGTTKAN